ncbi:hypothetical protein IP88_00440 [alpha proteobacterium AAP81b]|nr:hypothetical protein IP88_00440 [alpha proteobacterium AAP81b]
MAIARLAIARLAIALLAAAPAAAAEPMAGHDHDRLLSFTRGQADYARARGEDIVTFDGEGWIGGDAHKFWWKTEGDIDGGKATRAEIQALYSRNVWAFFDVQAGIRHDIEPDGRGYAVIGVQGLAPYLLDTEAHLFVGFRGDVHVRLRQSFDLLLTNRLIVTPQVETDLYLTDAPERRVRAGFSRLEGGVQARYEISRKFAPYLAVIYDAAVGPTAALARADGRDPGGWRVSVGVRSWF